MKLLFNLLCRDPQAQMQFYAALLGLPEAVASRSPIYRGLQGPSFELGFNALAAYELLALADRQPTVDTSAVTGFATLLVDSPEQVTQAADTVTQLGGTVIKPPYATYYGQWQTVLADPEQNAFRVSCLMPGTEHRGTETQR